jgi:uncharacterized membrane protein
MEFYALNTVDPSIQSLDDRASQERAIRSQEWFRIRLLTETLVHRIFEYEWSLYEYNSCPGDGAPPIPFNESANCIRIIPHILQFAVQRSGD